MPLTWNYPRKVCHFNMSNNESILIENLLKYIGHKLLHNVLNTEIPSLKMEALSPGLIPCLSNLMWKKLLHLRDEDLNLLEVLRITKDSSELIKFNRVLNLVDHVCQDHQLVLGI